MTLSKTSAAIVALLAIATASFVGIGAAEAGPWHHRHHGPGAWGPGAWEVGAAGLVIGGLVAASQPTYAEPVYEEAPVRRCRRVEQINSWGEVIGWRRVCRVE